MTIRKHEWIRERIDALEGKTQAGLAETLGLDRSAVTNIIKGTRQVKGPEVGVLARFLDMPEQDVLRGLTGTLPTLSLAGEVAVRTPAHRDIKPKSEAIPEVDVRGGMGGGGVAMAFNHTDEHGNTVAVDDVKAAWDLPTEYLRHELRVSAAEARIIEVQGDSMEPTLRPGDRVMVNLGDKRPSPPGVFAVWDGFGVVVKRIEPIPNSDPPTLRLISDNDRHGVYERTLDEVNIIGRVVWFARRM